MGRLKIFAIIGCCPFEQMDKFMEFLPIDEVAKAILLLSETLKRCVIFHPINHHNMVIGDVIRAMKTCGLEINFVEQEEFQAAWQKAEDDPDKAKILTTSIAYRVGDKDKEIIVFPKNICIQCRFFISSATTDQSPCENTSKNLSACCSSSASLKKWSRAKKVL